MSVSSVTSQEGKKLKTEKKGRDNAAYMREYRAKKKLTLVGENSNTKHVTPRANNRTSKPFDYSRYMLVTLLCAGSLFLITEQVTFYQACGYNLVYAIFLAVLLEVTPVAMAYFASVYKKPLLNIAIIPAVLSIGAVIFLGLQSRSNTAENVTRGTAVLESQIELLQEQAKEAEGKKLDRIQSEILKKQEALRHELPKNQTDTVPELWIFAVIRFFAFVYNLIFARLLGGS